MTAPCSIDGFWREEGAIRTAVTSGVIGPLRAVAVSGRPRRRGTGKNVFASGPRPGGAEHPYRPVWDTPGDGLPH